MSKEKILREHQLSLIYTINDWNLLEVKRKRAIELLNMLERFKPYVYGSIARGNVHAYSDIDIILLDQIPSYQIEMILEQNRIKKYFREIIMATPQDSIRLYIYLSELECITIPITKLEKKTIQFYDFGGKISLNQVKKDIRVPGIDKRLVLIRPTPEGHDELSIIDNEHIAAKEVGISIETVNERKKVLLRREKHGRTGVFLKKELEMDESTEDVMKKLANRYSIIRKKMFTK